MRIRSLVVVAGLLAGAPAFAQATDTKAALDAANWETLQKLYPPRALAAREEGAVGFKVTLDSKGSVTRCEVTHSSGHPLLDQETCNLITLHALFKPDAGIGSSQQATHQGVIAWKLPASSSTMAAPKALAEGTAPEKVICKKTPKTGSLASFERTCMTAREWARQSEESRQPWEEMQGRKGSTSGN
jgi:TonB family protein